MFPVYTLWGLAATAALSVVVYFVAARLCPVRIVTREVPYATGSEDVDAMLAGIEKNLDALHALNDAIPRRETFGRDGTAWSGPAGASCRPLRQTRIRQARSTAFARYYLPEVVKIMAAYARMEQGGIKGDNADQIQSEVRANARHHGHRL